MLVKYGESVTPFRKEKSGVTFFSGTRTPSAATGQKNDRWRYPHQNKSRWAMIHLARQWRELLAGERALWELWARTYPQPADFPASGFLTGYQNFVRRNYWLLYADGFTRSIMTNPQFEEIEETTLDLSLVREGEKLILYYDFGRNDDTLEVYVWLSYPMSHGRNYGKYFSRYMCKLTNVPTLEINYGILYNWYTTQDIRNVAAAGFHVPSELEFNTLVSFVGGTAIAGGKLKESGFTHWLSPNTGATNESGFTAKGTGERRSTYQGLNFTSRIWSKNSSISNTAREMQLFSAYGYILMGNATRWYGQPIHLIKDDNIFQPSYTGNDGKRYDCVQIGSQIWVKGPIAEEKFRNGNDIPLVTNQASWEAMTTAAKCYYNNDIANAYTGGANSIDITDMFKNMFGILPLPGQRLMIKNLWFAKKSGQKIKVTSSYIIVQ